MGTVDSKTALLEFEKFAEHWDIDTAVDEMSAEDKQGFEDQRRRFVRAVKLGRACVDDEGAVRYMLISPVLETEEIVLKLPRGASYMAMDRYKDRENMHKLQAFMADMSGKSPKIFAGMDGRDLKFFIAVVTLFLGS